MFILHSLLFLIILFIMGWDIVIVHQQFTKEAEWKCMKLDSHYNISGNNIIITQEFKNLHKWQTIDVEGIIASTEYWKG